MPRKPQAIRPPAHLDRADKFSFRKVIERLEAAQLQVSEAQTPLICGLVSAEQRIGRLEVLLARCAAGGIDATSISEFVALNGQINATIDLAHRIEGRLGL